MGKITDPIAERIRKKAGKDIKGGVMGKITHYIPGWHGYQEKEERRSADKVLREFLADQLRLVKQDIEKLQAMMVDYNLTKTWETFDRMLALTDKIESAMRYADYGYAGWGSKEKINEKELDKMYQFDSVLIDDIGAINDVVEEFTEKMNEGKFDDAWNYTYRLWQIMQRLEEKWNQREGFMKGYQE
ncbi:MAG: hypothetical protein C4K49_11600 [Candidatus Thorarchaeota archaeon]|nr:MAG: hypothetical protein C4K49_11600 [Candidatus Thorarchaeota archaeon]